MGKEGDRAQPAAPSTHRLLTAGEGRGQRWASRAMGRLVRHIVLRGHKSHCPRHNTAADAALTCLRPAPIRRSAGKWRLSWEKVGAEIMSPTVSAAASRPSAARLRSNSPCSSRGQAGAVTWASCEQCKRRKWLAGCRPGGGWTGGPPPRHWPCRRQPRATRLDPIACLRLCGVRPPAIDRVARD